MDNDAFRALVQERSRDKTSKEIAREAVEEEFEKRRSRKRGRGGGGSSSESEGDASNSDRDESKEEEEKTKSNKRDRPSSSAPKEQIYRDRAKERREGKDVDYAASKVLLRRVVGTTSQDAGNGFAEDSDALHLNANANENENVNENTMDRATLSKYLGGDEAHTHLVKGLDVALARKMKREIEMGLGPATTNTTANATLSQMDLDDVLLKAKQKLHQQDPSSSRTTNTPDTKEEAILFLRQTAPRSLTTQLGREIYAYLQPIYAPLVTTSGSSSKTWYGHGQSAIPQCSPAGRTIQRSTLTFSTRANPSNATRAWEIPLQNTIAGGGRQLEETATMDGNILGAATPLDHDLLQRIKLALSENSYAACIPQEKETSVGNRGKNRKEKKLRKETETNPQHPNHADSSDEDIFADIGEYAASSKCTNAPKQVTSGNKRKDKSSTPKESIFSGLVVPARATTTKLANTAFRLTAMATVASGHTSQKQPSSSSVIDRDIFGSRALDEKGVKIHTAETGVSVSMYTGGYGEEMDVDFDGRFAEDDEKDMKNQQKGDEVTTAALEYGRRGKRKSNSKQSP